MKHILIFLAFFSFQASACRNGTQNEMYEIGKEEFHLEKDFAKNLAKEVDSIFIATVVGVNERDDIENKSVTVFDVTLKDIEIIKGAYSDGVHWKEEVDPTINISCGVPVLYNFVSVEETYTYLFYVKNFEILRVNYVGPEIPVLTGKDELKLISENGI